MLVDDDEEIRRAYAGLIEIRGYACETYDSAARLLAVLKVNRPRFPGPRCVLSDVSMPEMDGLQLQCQLARHPDIPLILISGSSGLDEALVGFRAGALDFLVKPIDAEVLFTAVAKALALSTERQRHDQHQSELATRLATLTPRELEVAQQVVRGLTNREIGALLGLAERTIKLYRQRAMEKLGTASLTDLVRLIDAAALTDQESTPTDRTSKPH